MERRVPGLPAPRAAGEDDDRYLLFAAIAALLTDAAATAPVVLILDDLHWADRTTILLLRHLIAARATPGVATIVTYRSTELDADSPLGRLLADLHRERHVTRLELGGLAEDEIVALIEHASGQDLDARGRRLAHTLRDETGGNAFFVSELLRSLVESGHIYRDEDGWQVRGELSGDALPRSVRDVILRRVRRLGEEAFDILATAAVIGRDVEVRLLARALGDVHEDDLADLLDAAVEANLLVEVASSDVRFSFAHALIEYTLYDELSSARRRRAHRHVGEALEELSGDDRSSRVGELAFHWAQAANGTTAKAQEYARQAGDRALAQLAFDEAVNWYRETLRLSAVQPEPDERAWCELLFCLGDALRRAGDRGYGPTLREAAERARAIGATDVLVRAALANTRGVSTTIGDVDTEQIAVLEAALDAVGDADGPERAQLLAMLATELLFDPDEARRTALSDEAMAIAHRIGDHRTLLRVTTDRFMAVNRPETAAERLADLDEAVAAIEDEDDFLSFMSVRWRTNARLTFGDVEGAREDAEYCLRLAEKTHEPLRQWVAQFPQMQLAHLAGDLERFERLANDMLELGTRAGQADTMTFYAAALVALRHEQGRMAEMQPLYAQAVAEHPRMPAWRGGLALADVEAGQEEEGRELLRAATELRFTDLPRDAYWLVGLAQWAEAAAKLGERDACAQLYDLLVPFRDQLIDQGAGVWRTVAHHLALLSIALGDREQAERDVAHALALHERVGAPLWIAASRAQLEQLGEVVR
jgi:tetratricopeptide (TPR) repeat protein